MICTFLIYYWVFNWYSFVKIWLDSIAFLFFGMRTHYWISYFTLLILRCLKLTKYKIFIKIGLSFAIISLFLVSIGISLFNLISIVISIVIITYILYIILFFYLLCLIINSLIIYHIFLLIIITMLIIFFIIH